MGMSLLSRSSSFLTPLLDKRLQKKWLKLNLFYFILFIYIPLPLPVWGVKHNTRKDSEREEKREKRKNTTRVNCLLFDGYHVDCH